MGTWLGVVPKILIIDLFYLKRSTPRGARIKAKVMPIAVAPLQASLVQVSQNIVTSFIPLDELAQELE